MKTKILISMLVLGGFAPGPRAWAFPAAPFVTDVTSQVIPLGGKDYHAVELTLNGTSIAGTEAYRVPAKLLYPVNPADCNGTGIADLYNNSAMVLLHSENVTQAPLEAARARLTEEFLGAKGYFYFGFQWELSRDVITIFNQRFQTNFFIPSPAHQFAIILDAAMALRSPPQNLPGNPCAVSSVIGYGMSASTVPLNALKRASTSGPDFANGFAALYDGIIWDSITAGFTPPGFITLEGKKTMAISAETDVMLFLNHLRVRGESNVFRSYEVAGVTHVSRDEHDLDVIVPELPFVVNPPTRQNLITHSPVFRAMTEHMRLWIAQGTPPPPSVSLEGSNYALDTNLQCQGLPIPGIALVPRDAFGNAKGGVRLPFLSTEVCNGQNCKTIGSPLGTYDGMELQYGCIAGGFEQVVIVTGKFIRNDNLINSYTNHGKYVSGISQAAQYAFDKGWILQEDLDAFTATAGDCAVGHVGAADITIDDLKACHNTGP